MGEAIEKIASDHIPVEEKKPETGKVIYPDKFHKKEQEELTPEQIEERIKTAYEYFQTIILGLKVNSQIELNSILCDKITQDDLRNEKFDVNITKDEYSGLHVKMLPGYKLYIYFSEKVGDSEDEKQKLIKEQLERFGWDGEKINTDLRSRHVMNE